MWNTKSRRLFSHPIIIDRLSPTNAHKYVGNKIMFLHQRERQEVIVKVYAKGGRAYLCIMNP